MFKKIKALKNKKKINIIIIIAIIMAGIIMTIVKDINYDYIYFNNIKLYDAIAQYIFSFVLSISIIFIYFLIRFKKLGIIKIFLTTIFSLIIMQLLHISIYPITRLPINITTIPISILVFILTIFWLTLSFEKKLIEKNKELEPTKQRKK